MSTLTEVWNDMKATQQGWVLVHGYDRPIWIHRTQVYRPKPEHGFLIRDLDVLVSVPVKKEIRGTTQFGPGYSSDVHDADVIWSDIRSLSSTTHAPVGHVSNPAGVYEGFPQDRFDAEETWIFQFRKWG